MNPDATSQRWPSSSADTVCLPLLVVDFAGLFLYFVEICFGFLVFGFGFGFSLVRFQIWFWFGFGVGVGVGVGLGFSVGVGFGFFSLFIYIYIFPIDANHLPNDGKQCFS
jgi:hypothetical protein